MRARIVVVKGDPSLSVGFPDFLEENWQANVAIICLEVLRARATFVGFGSS